MADEIRVKGLYVGPEGCHTSIPVSKIEVAPDGIIGDRHRGMYKFVGAQESHIAPKGSYIPNFRQITIVSQEELAEIALLLEINRVEPEALSANIKLWGIPNFTGITKTGDWYLRFRSHRDNEVGAILRLMGENRPCVVAGANLEDLHPELPGLKSAWVKPALGKRGQVAIVYRPGIIREQSIIELVPHQPGL